LRRPKSGARGGKYSGEQILEGQTNLDRIDALGKKQKQDFREAAGLYLDGLTDTELETLIKQNRAA
jgi:hypothetical protein